MKMTLERCLARAEAAFRSLLVVAGEVLLFERALGGCERVFGADRRETLKARNNLGITYHDARRDAEAILLLERAVSDLEGTLGPDHPDTRTMRENLET